MELRVIRGYSGAFGLPDGLPLVFGLPIQFTKMVYLGWWKQKGAIMKYYVWVNEAKRRKDGLLPVAILFKDGTKRFVLNTGLTTSVKFKGIAFPAVESNARAKTKALMRIIDNIETYVLSNENASWDEIKRRLTEIVTGKSQNTSKNLVSYILDFADTKQREGTKNVYLNTAKKVEEYDSRATFDTVDKAWLDGFVGSMGDASVNYTSIQLRNLRAVFNWAIDNEWTQSYPFRRYKIKSERVSINNITLDELRKVRDYPLDDWRRIYRDLFMLSFYLCGINPADLLNLKHTDMKNGRIKYKRLKTGKLYDIPVCREAQEIIDRYKGKNYLLCPLDTYKDRRDFCHHWNDALKKIGPVGIVKDKVGKLRKHEWHPIVNGMTVYTARYTFASLGAELEIPRETIALCLGHSWADVTSHYIAYDLKRIDEAVRKIIDYVNADIKK